MHRIETEAKFLVREAAVHQAVGRMRRLGRFQVVERSRQRQRNTYLDTADQALRRSREVLKLRQVGRFNEVTFKREIRFRRGVSSRIEITSAISKARVPAFLNKNGRLSIKPVQWARKTAGGRSLSPVFTLLTDRRKRILEWDRHRIELDLDRVTFHRPGGGRFSFLEVELENLTASPQLFHQALSALKRRFGKGLRPSRIPKAEFGFRRLQRENKVSRT
ncbi:MAG: CYTH domain-containing protein [Candidatus Omnitrophica bacterium]|nr:CYTH domain-containing protein [Candidatus Omnitrophota bacterium]